MLTDLKYILKLSKNNKKSQSVKTGVLLTDKKKIYQEWEKENEEREVGFAKTNFANFKFCLGLPLPARKGGNIYIFSLYLPSS